MQSCAAMKCSLLFIVVAVVAVIVVVVVVVKLYTSHTAHNIWSQCGIIAALKNTVDFLLFSVETKYLCYETHFAVHHRC